MKRVITLATTLLLVSAASSTGGNAVVTQRERAAHVLGRLSFGPRPGEIDRVAEMGVDRWIEEQLHPERISDRAIEARLASYPTLSMSGAKIWDEYYAPVLAARKEARKEVADGNGDPEAVKREVSGRIPRKQRPRVVMEELSAQRILRAADSERQLNEVMVDFWMNHFNVFSGKGIDKVLLTSYERDDVRPHVWGHFEDLLMATAKSPAMLFYLDNARSVADPANRPTRPQRGVRRGMRRGRFGSGDMVAAASRTDPMTKASQKKGGLNENYAREIMELHTLGVDGGYSQKDVTELARVFTGWTISKAGDGGGFVYRRQLHDAGAKTVLGVHFPAGGGQEEGERMIRVLAHHPATAHHIAFQLCQRLVADTPPAPLVDRVAKTFLSSDGDLRLTVKAVIDSPEFWNRQYAGSKVKSPFQYVISAIRALGARIDDPSALDRSLTQIGEPLYGAQPPTGYGERSDVWINSGALMNRLNFALALAANKVDGVHCDVVSLIPAIAVTDAEHSVDAMASVLTGGELTSETKTTIRKRVEPAHVSPQDLRDNTQLPMIAGLILGSPEFQKQH